mgnify:CR=1 FL=1
MYNHLSQFYVSISIFALLVSICLYIKFYCLDKKHPDTENSNIKQPKLASYLLVASIPLYAVSSCYHDLAKVAELKDRYADVLHTKPQYSCATYMGMLVTSVVGGRPAGPSAFKFADGTIKRHGDEVDYSVMTSLKEGEVVCIKYLVIPAGPAEVYGLDGKRILQIVSKGSLGTCHVNEC